MRHAWLVAILPACGRVGFDARGDGGRVGDGAVVGDAGIIATGLVAYYPLDDDFATGTVHDRSGHGHDGSCAACPTTAIGRRGHRVASFDGLAQRVSVPQAPELQFAGGFSVAAWITPGRVPGDYDSAVAQPVGSSSGNSYQLDITSTQLAEYYDGQDLYSTTTTPPGTLRHVAATWDGLTKRLYVDGVLENQASSSPPLFDAQALVLGCDVTAGAATNFFRGELADVALYDRTLSTAEIALLAAP